MYSDELVKKVILNFGTNDVFKVAEKAGVKIIFQKWFPVTAGEFHWKTKTITVNENAAIQAEKIIAHELGHYFLRECKVKNVIDEERFCNEFANKFLKAEEEFQTKAQTTES